MEKGQSPSKANKGMHRFVSGRSWAVLVGSILVSVLVFNLSKKKKKSEEKESIEGASTAEKESTEGAEKESVEGAPTAQKESIEGASSPSLISPIPIGGSSDGYDVFLSFRGSDTRKAFTNHLYHSLVRAGNLPICVFRDDDSLPIGEEFGSQLLDAIRRSKISIPIISENYASSKWCLRELIHIMDCQKSTSHKVLPIFYKVDPSDVRYLKGSFGKAFHSHKNRFDEKDILDGPQALKEASNLNGWESEKIANGHEGELIKLVVKIVQSELQRYFKLNLPKELVGIDGHLNEIMNRIDRPSVNARMIGIYGMGGIGKTTLAKCIYNHLSSKFEHISFLQDIRATTQRRRGITNLQSQLIFDILKRNYQVSKVDDGINMIKLRFQGKKVLIVLDDIDHKNQLDALAGEHNWFASGSIIIVTTRSKDVLDQSEFEVENKFKVKELDGEHSLLLFNKHAFRKDHSPRDFEGISQKIISTMGGLPLALKVTGSYLYGKMDQKIWQNILKKLNKELHRDVQTILKISYDALDHGHQQIFLDIACFFIDEKSNFAIYMWEDCEFYAIQGIEGLRQRCLIEIEDDGRLRMHDQLRDLARNIICQEGPLETRSRLWVYEEAFKVLTKKKGTEKIQAICLDGYRGHLQTYTNEQFKSLQSLRFLHLRRAAFSGDFSELFSELRWLQWFDIEPILSFSATNLHLPNLLVLRLSHNEITEHWRGWSSFTAAKRLKVLDLKSCYYLRCTPDLTAFKELEILILSDCRRLEQVSPSIGKVKGLVSLDLSECGNLKELPEKVGELEELKELILDSSGITRIPTSIGSLKNLEKLTARDCRSLREIPNSIGGLSSLQHLSLGGCYELQSLPKLPYGLTHMSVSCQSDSLPQLSCLIHIEELFLYECSQLEYIPELSQLRHLRRLHVKDCYGLVEIQGHDNLKFLEEMVIDCCESIDRLILPELHCLKQLKAKSCKHLVEIRGLDGAEFLEALVISDCESIERLPVLSCFQSLKELNITGCKSLEKLPNLSKFENLENFTMRYSLGVREIPGVEESRSLTYIDITGCESMETLPNLSGCEKLQSLVVRDCKRLAQLWGLEKLDLIYLDISGCDSMEEIPNLPRTRVFRNYERVR